MRQADPLKDFNTWWREEMAGEYYTPAFNKNLLALMANKSLSAAVRIYAWLVYNSWGNRQSFVCHLNRGVGARWLPGSQMDCANDLDLDKRIVSEVVNQFEQRGILRKQGGVLVLDHKARIVVDEGSAEPGPVKQAGRYKAYQVETWAALRPGEWTKLSGLRAQKKEIENEIEPLEILCLSDFKEWEKRQTDAGKEKANDCANGSEASPQRSDKKSATGVPWGQSHPYIPKSLKKDLSESALSKGTTTTFSEQPSSSSFKEFRDRLNDAFLRTHKPVATDDQATYAFQLLESHWEEFLIWLPGSKPFRKTEHGGGLLSLIKFFEASRAAVADGKPAQSQQMTAQEVESYWRDRWKNASAQERADIERIVSDIDFKSKGAA